MKFIIVLPFRDGRDDKKITTLAECVTFVGNSILQIHQVARQLDISMNDGHDPDVGKRKGRPVACFSIPVPKVFINNVAQGSLIWCVKPYKGTNMKKRLRADSEA